MLRTGAPASLGDLDEARLNATQALGVLADEAGDAAPVPERPPGEEALVGDGLVVVDRDRLRDVPALPAGLARAVGEVDLLAVEPVALVEAAELVEQLAAEEEERAEQPVGGGRLGRVLVEQVVAALALLRARAGGGAACGGRSCRRRSGSSGARAGGGRRGSGARGGDPAARVLSANSRSAAMQPSAASMSEFEATTYGAVVAATPRLMFAPKPSVVSFRIDARRRRSGRRRGWRRARARRPAARATRGTVPGRGRRASRSRLRRRRSHELPVDGEGSAGGLGPGEARRAGEAGCESRSRSASARSIPPASSTGFRSATRIAASPAASGSAPAVVVTTGVPEAIASSTGSPKPS